MKKIILSIDRELEELKRHLHRSKKEKMKASGFLHGGEQALLKLINEHQEQRGKKPTAVELCQVLGLAQATATPLIDRLIKKGFVQKEVSSQDKRAKLLSLTTEGSYILAKHQAQKEMSLVALIKSLGEEDARELERILSKINQHFQHTHQQQ